MSDVLDDEEDFPDLDLEDWDESEIAALEDYLDALDGPPACPRCSSAAYSLDVEFRAWVCDTCGLWLDDDSL